MRSILASVFLLIWQLVYGQSAMRISQTHPDTIEIEVESPRFESSAVVIPQGGSSPHTPPDISSAVRITLDRGTQILEKGCPDIGKLSTTLRIPEQGDIRIEVLSTEYEDIPQVLVAPSKGNLTRDINPADIPYSFGAVYQQDAWYPNNVAQVQDPFVLRSTRGVHMWFFPVQYHPLKRTLRHHKLMRLRLVRTQARGVNEVPPTEMSVSLGATADNICRRLYQNQSSSADARHMTGTLRPEKMLVLCPDAWRDEIMPLVQHKNRFGVETILKLTSEMQGTDTTSVINLVRQMYQTEEIDYLLLVGDEDVFPPPMRLSGAQFSCDHCYGYLTGNDTQSEVLVGRFHATSAQDVRLMVQRNLEYELLSGAAATVPNTWQNTQAWIASDEGAGIGDDGQADWEHANDWKIKQRADGCGDFYELYDGDHAAHSPTVGHPTADQPGNPTQSDVVHIINSRGIGMLNYTGHGSADAFTTSGFNRNAALQLTNTGRYPICVAVSCLNGHFTSNTDCLGEALQRAHTPDLAPAGVVAGFYSSDYQTWAPPMEGQDAMQQYLIDADGLTQIPNLGGMSAFAQWRMVQAYGQYGAKVAYFWNPFHEPTLVPRTREAVAITLGVPTDIQVGENNISISCNQEGALVCASIDDQILGVARVLGGFAHIIFHKSIDEPGELMIAASRFNCKPALKVLDIKPVSGPFVRLEAYEVRDDMASFPNGQADYSETISLQLQLKNVGFTASDSVRVTVSTQDPHVTIMRQPTVITALGAGAATIQHPTSLLKIKDSIPDGLVVQLMVQIDYGGGQVYTRVVPLRLHAPSLQVLGYEVDDTDGNQNKRLDAGESVKIRLRLKNKGSSPSSAGAAKLRSTSPFLNYGGESPLLMLQPDEELFVDFAVQVATATPISHMTELVFSAEVLHYSTEKTYEHVLVNPFVADFTQVGLNNFHFGAGGNKPWSVSSGNPYAGQHCARSGVIGHNQSSVLNLKLNFTEAGRVRFARSVSSERGFDFLRFYIDSVLYDAWSGVEAWAQVSYPITPGVHTLRWEYTKDDLLTEGFDAAWIDEIILPSFVMSVDVPSVPLYIDQIALFPNPTSGVVTIKYDPNLDHLTHVSVLNALGHQVNARIRENGATHQGTLSIDLTDQPSGVYFVRIRAGSDTKILKLLLSKNR